MFFDLRRLLFPIVAGLLSALPAVVEAQSGGLFSAIDPAEPRTDSGADALPGTLRSRRVRIDRGQLAAAQADTLRGAAPAATLTLNLFDDAVFRAVVEQTAPTFSGGYALTGRLDGAPLGTLTLAVNGDAVAGAVRTPEATYSIRTAGAGVYVIRQVDLSALPPEAEPLLPPEAKPPVRPAPDDRGAADAGRPAVRTADVGAEPPAAADDGSVIDVMVVYTPAAKAVGGGKAAIKTLIDLFVAGANQAYADSGATQRIRLVWTAETAYDETGNAGTDLDRLTDLEDGYMDEVHALRDTHGADLVHLISAGATTRNYCGIAWFAAGPNPDTGRLEGNPRRGFGITAALCGSRTFAHELGHSMGLRHETYVDNSTSPWFFTYSHGYVNQAAFAAGAPTSARWRTIMTYGNQCADAEFYCLQLLRFSNPNHDVDGDALGVADESDARRALDATRTIVAGFRTEPARASDLVVQSPTVSAGIVPPSHSFTFSATVRNQGAAAAAATTLRCYRSTDATITTGDTQAGTAALGGLSANNVSIETISLTASTLTGTFYYGACVDSVAGESDTTNNCSTAVQVTVDGAGVATDRAALVALYNATDGPNWGRNTNWFRGDLTLGTWHGVTTDASGRVTELSLDNNALTGSIPAELGNLANLEWLNLSSNGLTGSIPTELGNLANLQTLSLSSNGLTGSIPAELGNLANLQGLYLNNNGLTGSIPTELGNLANLEGLVLRNNELTGSIPTELGNLANLEWLFLHNNELTGSVPTELGNLANLEWLDLGRNELTGSIPAELGNLPLDHPWATSPLVLDQNRLNSCIPRALAAHAEFARFAINPQQSGYSLPRCLESSTPDLIAQAPAVTDSALTTPGPPFTFSAFIVNRGGGAAAATTLRYYRSADATITTEDIQVGTAAVSGLAAHATSAQSIALRAPTTAGTYYYGACVDSVAGESDTTNNCSDGVRVAVESVGVGFTDDPIVAGVTVVKAAHFSELRERIDVLRAAHGLAAFPWTDPSLQPGVTPVKAAHLSELRTALDGAYDAAGRSRPAYTDAARAGVTVIKAVHVNELRRAIEALE